MVVNELKINNKHIKIFCKNSSKANLSVVILNCYGDEAQNVFDECLKIQCKDFILVTISNLDWDNDMTPYYCPKIYKNGNDYLGHADEYIESLESEIIPKVQDYIENTMKVMIDYFGIAGYSLGGLFAVYSCYKTNIFKRVASCSGSFWYPNFENFVKENELKSKIEKMYFSLGNKESKTTNLVLSKVEECTKNIEQSFNAQGIKTIYEENVGNHFQEADLRTAKGIKWILVNN